MLSDAKLKSANARAHLDARPKPYAGPTVTHGVQLLYRRNAGSAGAWIVKFNDGFGRYIEKRIALADDIEEANGTTILTMNQAKPFALEIARGKDGATVAGAVLTVLDAVKRYEADLLARGRKAVNARCLYKLLPSTLA